MNFVNSKMIDPLLTEAKSSPRKRAFRTLHQEDEPLNRVLIAGVAGSYAAPHRHREKFEAFSPLRGGVIVVEYDDIGTPINAYDLRKCPYVELYPMVWHSLIYTTDEWVLMEFSLWKDKYDPSDKEFAPWAPKEGDPGSAEYLLSLNKSVSALVAKDL